MINAENRNNITVIPPLMRQRTIRCCSFCRQPGHNLTTCNSDRLLEFEIICANAVVNMNSHIDFKNWLTENHSDDQLLLKVFAIRKFHVTTRTSIFHCIDLITEYIFRTYKNINIEINNQEEQEDENEFENEMINLLNELRNPSEPEPQQEIQDIPGIEQMVLREMVLYSLFNNMITTIRQQYNAVRKFNILSSVESNENENINENCECNICWEENEKKNFIKFGCNHEFCKDCVIKTLRTDQRETPCCALCRAEVKSIVSRTNFVQTELADLIA
jgi:hypothetical protein